MPAIKDGRAEFGVGLEDWYMGRVPGPRAGMMPKMARAIGVAIPSLSVVADAEPAQARIDWGRWIADCPCGGAQMVWLAGPAITWCGQCGNADLGGQWRPVAIPENAAELTASMAHLAPSQQQWRPEG